MRSRTKTYLRIIVFFAILLFAGIASLPSLISSSFGTKTLLKWVNNTIEGSLSIEKIDLHWFGTQRIEKIEYKDAQNKPIFSCVSGKTETSLLYLLLGGRSFGNTFLESPSLYLTPSHPDNKLAPPTETKISKKPPTQKFDLPQFNEALRVLNGTVIIAAHTDVLPVTVSEINVEKTSQPNHLFLKAQTLQGPDTGFINIDADLQNSLKANIEIQNLPLAVLDAFYGSRIYSESLGPTLNITARLEKKEGAIFIEADAKSANLTACIEGHTENETFIINPKSHLNFSITPSLFRQIIKEKQRTNWSLASKADLDIHIEKAIFPLSTDSDFKEIALKAHAQLERAEIHHSALGSYSLNHFNIDVSADHHIDLVCAGAIRGKEETHFEGSFSLTPQRNLLFEYVCQGFPVALLELVSDELENKVRSTLGNRFDLKGKGIYSAPHLETELTFESYESQMTLQLDGQLPDYDFKLSGEKRLIGGKTKLLGESFHFNLSGIAKVQEETSIVVPFFKGKLFNAIAEMDVSGKMGEEGKPLSLDQIEIVALGNIKQLPFEEPIAQSALENGTLYFHLDGSNNRISGKAESKALRAQFEVRHFIHENEIKFDQSELAFSCNLNAFPLSVVGPLLDDSLDLTPLLGKTLSLTSQGTYTPKKESQMHFDIQAQGEGFEASLGITLDKNRILKQNKPSFIYWDMTPERYSALMHFFHHDQNEEQPFFLTRPTKIEIDLQQFSCPTDFKERLGILLCKSGFVGDLRIGTMEFKNRQTKESITFQEMKGSIKGENFSKAIDLTLDGQIFAPNIPHSEGSAFAFSGQMFNFWTQAGKFNKEGLSVKGDLNLSLLPVRQITGIFPMDQEKREMLQAVLGELVNARISGEISQMTGPISIDIKSSNLKVIIPLELKKSAAYLRDYVNAEITLTPAVNETLLKDINPLIIAGAFSDHPLKVFIDPKGFEVPIRPFSLEKVQIANAVVELGKIRVKNGGQIQSLMQFLKAKELSPDGLMEAWFTPIYLNLHQGVATYRRFDGLLAQSVHIALWGSINLINKHVDMTLAIAPTTLYERFKISGLTNKDMFQVKMKGTTSKLDLDWSSAYTRIAWIVARSSVGFLSDILGGVLEQLVSNLGGETVPPPTTDPLPWGEK